MSDERQEAEAPLVDPRYVLTILTRIAAREPGQQSRLEQVLEGRLAEWHVHAIKVAFEQGEPMGRALAGVLARKRDLGVARAILDRAPLETWTLLEATVQAELICIESASEGTLERAKRLYWVGARESKLGNLSNAVKHLEAAQKAVRDLDPSPEQSKLESEIYGSLAACMVDLGRPADGVRLGTKAFQIYSGLKHPEPPDDWRGLLFLSQVTSNLGVCNSALGKHVEALQFSQLAARTLGGLIAERPALKLDYAIALANLAAHYSELGKHDDALMAANTAQKYLAPLAAQPRARGEVLPQYALLLSNYGGLIMKATLGNLSTESKHEAAEYVATRAVDIYRQLAAWRPIPFNARLAGALQNLAIVAAEIGHGGQAIDHAREAAALYQELIDGGDRSVIPDLMRAIGNVANRLREENRLDDSVDTSIKGLQWMHELTDRQLDANARLIMTLAGSLTQTYEALRRAGPFELRAARLVETYRRLAAWRPASFTVQLASALEDLATAASDAGHGNEALSRVQEAVGLHQKAVDGGNRAALPYLMRSIEKLGYQLHEHGRLEEAIETSISGLHLVRELSDEQLEENAGLVERMADHPLGCCGTAIHRSALSERMARRVVETYRELAAWRSAPFLSCLAGALENLTIVHKSLGNGEQALSCAQEAVALYQQLVDGGDRSAIPHLMRATGSVANRLREQGRLKESIETSVQGLLLAGHLSEQQMEENLLLIKTMTASLSHSYAVLGEPGLSDLMETLVSGLARFDSGKPR